MSLEQLIEELDARASVASQAVLEKARAEAAGIREAAQRARTFELNAHLAELERAERATAEARVAEARRRAAAESLAARDAFLDRVITMAERGLPEAAASPVFRSALPALLEQARAFVGVGATARLRAGAAMVNDLSPMARALGFAIETEGAPDDGFLLACGRVTIEQTLSARLRQRLPELRQWVATAAMERAECAGKT